MNFEEGDSLTGLVLAAMPELLDPNFHKTIVFIAEHGVSGALGFVMNRPLGRKLAEVSKASEMPESMQNLPVFEGGPVKPTGLLFARFGRGTNDEELVCEILADPRELGLGCVRAF